MSDLPTRCAVHGTDTRECNIVCVIVAACVAKARVQELEAKLAERERQVREVLVRRKVRHELGREEFPAGSFAKENEQAKWAECVFIARELGIDLRGGGGHE